MGHGERSLRGHCIFVEFASRGSSGAVNTLQAGPLLSGARGARECVSKPLRRRGQTMRQTHWPNMLDAPRRDAALRPRPRQRDGRLYSFVVTCRGLALCRWLHRRCGIHQLRGRLQLRLRMEQGGELDVVRQSHVHASPHTCRKLRLLTHLHCGSLSSSFSGGQLRQLSFAQLRRRCRLGAGQGCVSIRPPLGGRHLGGRQGSLCGGQAGCLPRRLRRCSRRRPAPSSRGGAHVVRQVQPHAL